MKNYEIRLYIEDLKIISWYFKMQDYYRFKLVSNLITGETYFYYMHGKV